MENNDIEEKIPDWVKIIITTCCLGTVVLLTLMAIAWYNGTFDAWYYSTPEMCEQPLPKGFNLVYNQRTDKYTIKINNEYIWIRGSNRIWCDIHPYPVELFSDSCRAKHLVYDYIKSKEREKIENNFK